MEQEKELRELAVYKYGFRDEDAQYEFVVPKGLSREVVEAISHYKGEPDWMRKIRLQALEIFFRKPMPTWGADLSELNFDEITYYASPTKRKVRSWDDVPEYIKRTYVGHSMIRRWYITVSVKTWSAWASSSWTWTRRCGSIPTLCGNTSAP